MKFINNRDDIRKYLQDIQMKMVKDHSDSELLERLLTKKEWDEQYLEVIKNEIKRRANQ